MANFSPRTQKFIQSGIGPEGWKRIEVPGDGSCGYHAIMKSLSEQANSSLETIKNNSFTSNPYSGFALRIFIAKKLKNIREEIANLNGYKNMVNVSPEELRNSKKQLNDIIIEYGLNNESNNGEHNINNILKTLDKNINDLENFNPESTTSDAGEWIDESILNLISKILRKNIFIYNLGANTNKWTSFIGNQSNKNNPNSSIFLLFTGAHYDTLIPDIDNGKFFKERFTNLPNRIFFNYNFLS